MGLPIILLLTRVQLLPAAYSTNNTTNNTVELLARVMACELLPLNRPTIVIYDSDVVHSQHLALLGYQYTNCQRTRIVFPAISRMLAQRLETTSPHLPRDTLSRSNDSPAHNVDTPTRMDTIMVQIRKLSPCGKK